MATTGTTKTGGKNKKFGRNSRAPSNQNQVYRTAKNKRLRIERETKKQSTPKPLKVARGTARRRRRFGVSRKG